jgi:hypothetical protein
VWKDIDQSGVELELRVASIFSKAGWGVALHQPYKDYDEDKIRELDFVGAMGADIDIPGYEFTLYMRLLGQCKKIPGNSWTFFYLQQDEVATGLYIPHMLALGEFQGRLGTSRYSTDDPFNDLVQRVRKTDAVATVYREAVLDPKKSNKRTDNLFEAVITITKAWEHYRRQGLETRAQNLEEYASELQHLNRAEAVRKHLADKLVFDGMNVYQPLIVFQGNMFVASMETRELKPAKLVRLLVDYQSSKYDVKALYVDVCHADHLKEYLEMYSNAFLEFELSIKTPRPPQYTIPGEKNDYDYSRPWIENMRKRVVDRLAAEVEKNRPSEASSEA